MSEEVSEKMVEIEESTLFLLTPELSSSSPFHSD